MEKREDLKDEEIQTIISSSIRKAQEAAEEFRKGDREDLALKEEKEINILYGYLPEQLSPDEIERILRKIISDLSVDSPKDLGKVYETLRTGIKTHTACRHEHPALDAVLGIVRGNGLKPEDIERVDIHMIGNAFRLVVEPEDEKRAPRNVVESMHSMYFGAAMAIIKRRAFIEEHTEGWLHSSQVRDLISKIYCHHDPDLDKLLPEKFPARAVIHLVDGKKFENLCEIPHGDGMNPLSQDELRGKYEPLARSIFSDKRVEEIQERIMHLEEMEDFGKVAGLLHEEGGEGSC